MYVCMYVCMYVYIYIYTVSMVKAQIPEPRCVSGVRVEGSGVYSGVYIGFRDLRVEGLGNRGRGFRVI